MQLERVGMFVRGLSSFPHIMCRFCIKSSSDLTLAPAPFLSLSNIQQKKRVEIWLYEDTRMSIEGQIIGFDEYMNMTLDDAAEVDTKTGKKVDVGRILLKGDAITLLQEA